jgi:hypothetical protein
LFQTYVQNLSMSVQQSQNKETGRTGVAPQGPNLADQVKSLIEQAKEAQKSMADGTAQAKSDVNAEVANARMQETQQGMAAGAQQDDAMAMVAQLMERGMSEEEAMAMVEQQMAGGAGGGAPQGEMPPEAMPPEQPMM